MAEDIWGPYRSKGKEVNLTNESEGEDIWDKYRDKQPEVVKPTYETKSEKYKKQLEEAKTPWQKIDAITNLTINQAKSQLPSWLKVPGHETMSEAISPSLTKGVPIARHFVPQTPELTEFEQKHPYISTGLNAAGTVGSMAAPLGGASNLVARSTVPGLGSGGNFLPQFMSQFAVNAPVNVADTAAKKGELTKEDLTHGLSWGAAESAVSPVLTKLFGQAPRMSNSGYWDYMRAFMSPGGAHLPSGARAPAPNSMFGPPVPRAGTALPQSHIAASITPDQRHALTVLGAAAAGLPHSDIAPFITGGAAHIARPLLDPLERGIGRVIAHPTTQDIIRALTHQARQQLDPAAGNQP